MRISSWLPLVMGAVLTLVPVQPLRAEPAPATSWRVTFQPADQRPTAVLNGRGAQFFIDGGCLAKYWPAGFFQAEWCSAPDGTPLQASALSGAFKGYVYLTRGDSPITYRYTTDGRFVDRWTIEANVVGSDNRGNVFARLADGRTQQLAPGGAVLAEWPEPLAVSESDALGTTYLVGLSGGPLRKTDGSGQLSTLGDGILQQPSAVTIDARRNVFVSDGAASLIQVFSPQGKLLHTVGKPGTAPGELSKPSGIALGAAGTIYIADTGNNRVQEFTPDGHLVNVFGSSGTGVGEFDTPLEVLYDPDSYLVVREKSGRVQRLRIVQSFSGHYWP